LAKPPNRQRPPVTTPSLIPPINVTDLTTYPLKKQYSKVRVSDCARPWHRGGSFRQFYRSLPDILGVKTLRAVAKAVADGKLKGTEVFPARMQLTIDAIGLSITLDGEIKLE